MAKLATPSKRVQTSKAESPHSYANAVVASQLQALAADRARQLAKERELVSSLKATAAAAALRSEEAK
eukprot:5394156-Ditylum_brightwellii.AAC.1